METTPCGVRDESFLTHILLYGMLVQYLVCRPPGCCCGWKLEAIKDAAGDPPAKYVQVITRLTRPLRGSKKHFGRFCHRQSSGTVQTGRGASLQMAPRPVCTKKRSTAGTPLQGSPQVPTTEAVKKADLPFFGKAALSASTFVTFVTILVTFISKIFLFSSRILTGYVN